ncbi:MAG TPA: GTPase [Planctomycetota bacterium]|jgi:tRNA modification GTPase
MIIPAAIDTHSPIFIRVTGAGTGGIAKLVLDGETVSACLTPCFTSRQPFNAAVAQDLLFGRLVDTSGAIVDEVVVAPVGKDRSETGNPQIELSCHGGVGVLAGVEEVLVSAGIERGRPTELLERAHLHNKLSLIAIEARLRLPEAATARQADFLLGFREFQRAWERCGFDLAMALRTSNRNWPETIRPAVARAIPQCQTARRLLAQHHVAILGPVNAGKSTLANALARAERHIVSEIPGTTLDRLDTPIELHGLSLLLTDTAGLRKTGDELESEGQQRALRAAESAALRLLVVDGSQAPDLSCWPLCETSAPSPLTPLPRGGEGDRSGSPMILVLNKRDLGIHDEAAGLEFALGCKAVAVSARSGEGLDELSAASEEALLKGRSPEPGAPFTRRHAELLAQMQAELDAGSSGRDVLALLRRLVGMRPNAEELARVMSE